MEYIIKNEQYSLGSKIYVGVGEQTYQRAIKYSQQLRKPEGEYIIK